MVDLRAEAHRLVLDTLAVDVCAALAAAGIPSVVLKGPSTSLWLYDPPRSYRDVDLLVPLSRAEAAARVLADAGIAERGAGRIGEEAPHSLMLRSPDGCELDLHVSLPTVPVAGDRAWHALSGHLTRLEIGVGTVPVLDEPARCLVIALHALNSGPHSGQPVDDLHRARAKAAPESWAGAEALARLLGASDLLDGALAMVDGTAVASARARLYLSEAPSVAFGLDRLLSARRRDLPRMVWREMFPTRGFMHYDDPTLTDSTIALLRAHLHRWRRLVRELPAAVRAVRDARSRNRGPESFRR